MNLLRRQYRSRAGYIITALFVLFAPVIASCSPAATPAPVATTPPTTPAMLSAENLGAEAYGYLTQLVEKGPRYTGAPGQGGAIDWLKEQFQQLGLAVEVQEFPTAFYSQEQPGVTIFGPPEKTLESIPLNLSASAEVSGQVVQIGSGKREEIPEGVKGRIALAERGQIAFSEKVANAAAAGATAIIIYNNVPGLFLGTLGSASPIPAIAISREDGLEMKSRLAQGEVRVKVWVSWQEHTARNIIARKAGRGNPIVIVGGHYDAVPVSPGANDNASGIAATLTAARLLAGQDLAGEVRFIGFGAEEDGLLGSIYYVRNLPAEERERVAGVLNLDVVGADVPLALAGDARLGEVLRSAANKLNIAIGGGLGDVASDHVPFVRSGIPAVILSTPDFSRIHSRQDAPEAINRLRLGEASLLTFEAVKELLR